MAINLTSFSKMLRDNAQKFDGIIKAVKTFDQGNLSVSLARILKAEHTPMIDRRVVAFSGNSAIGTRLCGLKLW
jgi:hypothetical protein